MSCNVYGTMYTKCQHCAELENTELVNNQTINTLRRHRDELEAENNRLTEALKLIERGTGGFANEVAKAALEGGE